MSSARSPGVNIGLLVIVLAGPDAASAIDGMHKVALEIGDKAKQLKQALQPE